MNGVPQKTESQRFKLNAGAASHRGLERANNQDKMTRFRTQIGEVFIVADGMGGHEGGEIAASMVILGFERYLKTIPAGTALNVALQEACKSTNQEILARSQSGEAHVHGMGSTVVLAVVAEDALTIGHVGDSRAYMLQDGQLQRLTKDHSFVQRLVDAQTITEEQAAGHPQSSVLTRAFGQDRDLEMEIAAPRNIQPGQYIILCSDGLSGYLADPEIARALQGTADPAEMTTRLINLALSAGGKDNVTIQVIQFAPRPVVALPVKVEPKPKRGLKSWKWSILVWVALLSGLILGAVLGPQIRGVFHMKATVPPQPAPVPAPKPPAAATPAPVPSPTPDAVAGSGAPTLLVEGNLNLDVMQKISGIAKVTPEPNEIHGSTHAFLYCAPAAKAQCDKLKKVLGDNRIKVIDDTIKPDPKKSYDMILRLQKP